MVDYNEIKCKCKLCGNYFSNNEMSEEHYPARSVGNEDIVELDIIKMFDTISSDEIKGKIKERINSGEMIEEISGSIFDSMLSRSLYPNGRTARTLCRVCNTFLGNYDEAYLKFYGKEGKPSIVKGFQRQTKYDIIKAIYAKFLSVPETKNEEFDFIDFLRERNATNYNGKWKLYFVKRDLNSDILGFKDIETGKAIFDEGVVYEFSDEKFIFNLMNFEKHACFEMTNIFDILDKEYILIEGTGRHGGYHAQMLMGRLLSQIED